MSTPLSMHVRKKFSKEMGRFFNAFVCSMLYISSQKFREWYTGYIGKDTNLIKPAGRHFDERASFFPLGLWVSQNSL